MYKLQLFNPVINAHETLLEIEQAADLSAAVALANNYLYTHGIARAQLIYDGEIVAQPCVFPVRETSATGLYDAHKCIPNNDAWFAFRAIRDGLGISVDRFLDLSCGEANVLHAANDIWSPTVCGGVEIDPLLCAIAGVTPDRVILNEDLFNMSFGGAEYDLIYNYETFRTAEAMDRFWDHVYSWIADGQPFFYRGDNFGVPEWLTQVEIPGTDYPCLYVVEK